MDSTTVEWSSSADPRYPFDLLGRVITVSLETVKIVKALPELDI
jgi:predicted helicase